MVCENVNVEKNEDCVEVGLQMWCERDFQARRSGWRKKNYNNVQVIFIRVETEAKRRKKNIKKNSRETKMMGRVRMKCFVRRKNLKRI